MSHVFRRIADLVYARRTFVTASVVETKGSTPQRKSSSRNPPPFESDHCSDRRFVGWAPAHRVASDPPVGRGMAHVSTAADGGVDRCKFNE